jgi:hypothetical protein
VTSSTALAARPALGRAKSILEGGPLAAIQRRSVLTIEFDASLSLRRDRFMHMTKEEAAVSLSANHGSRVVGAS